MITGYLLGVDVGTTSIKVAIINEKAQLLGMSSSSYKLIIPDQDSVQIDTEDMWRAYLKCIRLLKDGKGIDLSKVVGISISSLCPGLAALDENGKVLVDPIIYSDRRSTEEAEIIKKVVGEENVFDLKEPNMGGEDFAYFAQKVPSAFIFVGIANNKSEPVIHHNPYFKWDSKNVGILAQGLSQIAIDYLK